MRSFFRLNLPAAVLALTPISALLVLPSCSSGPEVRKEAYAPLKNQRLFEYEFPVVWKGIETAFTSTKITDRDPEEANEVELKKISHRSLETDWVYSRSRDKYVEYKVNGTPRRKELQIRTKYKVEAQKRIGGVEVTVHADEEVERLNDEGESKGFSHAEADSSRSNEMIEKINQAILAAPNL